MEITGWSQRLVLIQTQTLITCHNHCFFLNSVLKSSLYAFECPHAHCDWVFLTIWNLHLHMHLHTRQHHYSNAHTSAEESHDYHLSCELKKLHDMNHALAPPHDTSDQHPQKAHEGPLECQDCHLKLAVETFSPTLKRAVSPVSIEQCVFLNSIVLCCG